MVTVRIKISDKAVKIEAKGHALFDRKGRDVVCAAVSTLLESWFLGEKGLCEAQVDAEQKAGANGSFFAVMTGYGEREKLLLDSLILSLNVLKNQYGKNIKVTVEETHGRR